jgi:hypothetical protein
MKLGDMIHGVTQSLRISQCEACKRRQAWLNDLGGHLAKLKEVNSAVQEQSATSMDVRERAQDGSAMVEENAEGREAT